MNFTPDVGQSNEANTRNLGAWVEALGYKVTIDADEGFILHGQLNIGVWFSQPAGVPRKIGRAHV